MMPEPHPTLSVCMIVKNEAGRLPDCLRSLEGLSPEVIVVDTGSTDDTIQVARQLGASVVSEKWVSDFSRARNAGLALARGTWILVLDADESLPEASRSALVALTTQPPGKAFALLQRSPMPSGSDIIVSTVRLVPNLPQVRYQNSVHEELVSSLERCGIPIEETTVEIHDSGYCSKSLVETKRARNGAILDAALHSQGPVDPQVIYNAAIARLDEQDFDQAAEILIRCREVAASARPKLHAAAGLKLAETLVRSGRHREALPLLPSEPTADTHPLALALRATAEELEGRIDAARPWHEATLAAMDTAHMPPVAAGTLKLHALMALGDLWSKVGRPDIGAAVLRLALEISPGQRDADIGPSVLARYAAIVEAGHPESSD